MVKPALVVTRGREYLPHPRLVRMTAALAEKLLERNALNRPLRQGHAEELARRMLTPGVWKQNNATVGIAHNGDVLDGQHRLWGVVLADKEQPGIEIPMLVVEGLDPDVFDTIDTGRPRSAADVFAIAGGKNNSTVVSALRWLRWYEMKPRPAHPSSIKVSHTELLAFRHENPDIDEAARAVASTGRARALVPQSVLAFVYLLAARGDEGKAGAWLSLLNTGEGLDAKHPVLQLRERMLANKVSNAKLPPIDVCALTVKSWNFYLTGARRNVLSWRTTEPFPDVLQSSGR